MPRKNTHQKNKFQRFEFISTCQNKKAYKSETEAKKSAEYQMILNRDLDLKVYYCKTCDSWHLTKQKD